MCRIQAGVYSIAIESRSDVICSMCISWDSSFCQEPFVMRWCANECDGL